MALPTLTATIDGASVTSSMQSASWSLGPSDFLADLAPSTASLSFKGQVTAAVRDEVVISSDSGVQWTGYVDTITETRDVAGNYWTSIGATDVVGTLGSASLEEAAPASGGSHQIAETLATAAGITLDGVNDSFDSIALLSWGVSYAGTTFTGTVLEYINLAARSANEMAAMHPDGSLHFLSRTRLAYISNGTFDTNTTGWGATGTGASISRVTASPYAGAGNLRVVSGTDLFGGAYFNIGSAQYRFVKGITYRLSLYARTISGSADVSFGLGDVGASDRYAPTQTITASWANYTVDWTPTATRTAVSIDLRNVAAASNTFEVDSVTISIVPITLPASESWTKQTSLDVDINKWALYGATSGWAEYTAEDAADIAAYGERSYLVNNSLTSDDAIFDDWTTYGGSQRPVLSSGQFVITDDSQTTLMDLRPFDWVTDGVDDWQVMSLQHSYTVGDAWRVTMTGDNLLALL